MPNSSPQFALKLRIPSKLLIFQLAESAELVWKPNFGSFDLQTRYSRLASRNACFPANESYDELIDLIAGRYSAGSRVGVPAHPKGLHEHVANFGRAVEGADDSTGWMMATLSRMFSWRDALVNVQANTLIRWHRRGFRLLWRWKSKPTGRPRQPKDLRRLIREIPAENTTRGEERIANEPKLKLGLRVSPRTVEKCLGDGGPTRTPDPKQRWLTSSATMPR